jgi:hypothetical protein
MGGNMREVAISILAAVAVVTCACVSQEASADEANLHYTKKVRPLPHPRKCGPYDRCGFPVSCPSGTCYSLYGAYGPYGGTGYWGRYTYAGWGYR